MGKPIVELGQFRQDMKKLGYKVRCRAHSEFKSALVIGNDGAAINAGNVLTPEHIAAHKDFYDYRAAHSVRDGAWVVTI